MSTAQSVVAPPPVAPDRTVQDPTPPDNQRANTPRMLIGLVGLVVTVWFVANSFLAFAYHPEWFGNRLVIGLLALVIGVGGAGVMFWFLNMFVEGLPGRFSERAIPYAFLVPGLGFIALMLIYPTIQSINYSFANADSTEYVGLANYRDILTSGDFWNSMFNNLLWLVIVPASVVALGVVVAVIADKLSPRGEKVAKSLIFLPMAISFVGASAIWGLVYNYRDGSQSQTGVLNAIVTAFGGDPVAWLQVSSGRLNSLLLMVILIWLQVGFGMILLSSAIKGVPEDTLEAARIDGASELQIFWRIIIPQVRGTIITVFVTVLIMVLKVFDIVYVTTNGRDNSNVIANLFFNELFANQQAGRAAAIVVVLLIAILPVLIYQVRHFRREEMER